MDSIIASCPCLVSESLAGQSRGLSRKKTSCTLLMRGLAFPMFIGVLGISLFLRKEAIGCRFYNAILIDAWILREILTFWTDNYGLLLLKSG